MRRSLKTSQQVVLPLSVDGFAHVLPFYLDSEKLLTNTSKVSLCLFRHWLGLMTLKN